jgi:hypothetical protein
MSAGLVSRQTTSSLSIYIDILAASVDIHSRNGIVPKDEDARDFRLWRLDRVNHWLLGPFIVPSALRSVCELPRTSISRPCRQSSFELPRLSYPFGSLALKLRAAPSLRPSCCASQSRCGSPRSVIFRLPAMEFRVASILRSYGRHCRWSSGFPRTSALPAPLPDRFQGCPFCPVFRLFQG